jgi:hypothetical protein
MSVEQLDSQALGFGYLYDVYTGVQGMRLGWFSMEQKKGITYKRNP